MTESTHTPGPWKYDSWHEGISSKNGWVCHIPSDDCADYKAPGELEANARLIATSPDMYEELEHLATMTHKAFVSSEQVCFYIRKRVLPLLAKVRGEQ